ncbi:LOW QUALITY PROTEIN: uncharacterized protein LOC142462877 [Ascaphus truei]|uniref:LOW QUALITY PROTEIN: uncharacterized protein LOC142462877 n=1 Tax=Ascaphus truei TaxID=8439 RepID=UPI003F59EF41
MMASAGLREELNCSICLSIYIHPVTLKCGHNFCQVCIGNVWDSQEGSGVYTCPECRAEFQERPALQRNLKLCNIVERFLSTQQEQEEAVIFCTYCDSSVPAAKTCLLCDASLCDKHLKKHSKSEEHVLTEPTTSLENRKCSIHKKPLEYYCSEDAACICVSCCLVGEHRGHILELLNGASEKKKEKLRNVLDKLTSVREETEKTAQSLQEQKREKHEKAAGVTDRVTALFRDIREQLEVLEKRVLSEITRQEELVSLRVSDLIQQLEIKRDELSREMLHIGELCNIPDPLTVLQGRESDNADICDAKEGDKEKREREDNKVPAVGDLDEVLISLTLQRLVDIVIDLKVKRGFYGLEPSDILLDVNTAANDVSVSECLKTASWSVRDPFCQNTPERFMCNQVLSTRGFSSGQHYWEVETSESGYWKVGISYPSIERKGDLSWIGYNKKSWCLEMFNDNNHSVIHDSIETRIYPDSPLQRLGIYLDYEAGRLSFYQLCDPIRTYTYLHLHTFTATFTEPLYAVFWVCDNGWVRIRRRKSAGDFHFHFLLLLSSMASADLREELTCPICLSIYTQPVMLRCGHNFCQGCIGSKWDSQEGSGLYTCPDCRAEFQERPALQRNLKLCNIAERFLSTQPELEEAVIFCTYCDSSVPAAKTCLLCDASLCDKHLKRHSKSEEHVLTDPTTSLENRKCSIHKKILEYYCSEDAVCVCVSCCLVGEHRGHKMEPLNEASEKKKVKLRNVLEKLTSERQGTEKTAQSLQEQKRKAQEKAAGVTDRVTALFRDIREQLEVLEKRVLSEITRQEEQVSLQVSDLIQQLEIKRDELSREMLHIEELCNIPDPLSVLRDIYDEEQKSSSYRGSAGDTDGTISGCLNEAPISLILHRGLLNFSEILLDLKAKRQLHVPEASEILLDVNTACNYIDISNDLKSASYSSKSQRRSDVPERFKSCQVLSSSSFSSGQHYWEVDVSEAKQWIVGVAYPSIERKINGNESFIGYNDKSWNLSFINNLSAVHNNIWNTVASDSPLQRLGIYLDYEAGRLSFYQLCDPIRHLHTFTATFTEPLHAAFYVYKDSCIRIKRL